MSILTAIGFSLISFAVACYIVSLLRPNTHREHDEHEDF